MNLMVFRFLWNQNRVGEYISPSQVIREVSDVGQEFFGWVAVLMFLVSAVLFGFLPLYLFWGALYTSLVCAFVAYLYYSMEDLFSSHDILMDVPAGLSGSGQTAGTVHSYGIGASSESTASSVSASEITENTDNSEITEDTDNSEDREVGAGSGASGAGRGDQVVR